jgi:hypothetical protein
MIQIINSGIRSVQCHPNTPRWTLQTCVPEALTSYLSVPFSHRWHPAAERNQSPDTRGSVGGLARRGTIGGSRQQPRHVTKGATELVGLRGSFRSALNPGGDSTQTQRRRGSFKTPMPGL